VASENGPGFSIVIYYAYIRFSDEELLHNDNVREWFRLRAARKNEDRNWHTVSTSKASQIDASDDYNHWGKHDAK
jgi:hypothetical protein